MSSPSFKESPAPGKKITLALAGNPNVGKSSIFNALTGARQKVANYPGVTVEKKIGEFSTQNGKHFQLIDLPGTYSLTPHSEDEDIATKIITGQLPGTAKPDTVFVIVEASKLDRGLYLFGQIRQIHDQVILVVNMMDELSRAGLELDLKKLARIIKAPVIGTSATHAKGIRKLLDYLENQPTENRAQDSSQNKTDASDSLRDFSAIDHIVQQVLSKTLVKNKSFSDQIDKVLLHPLGGPLIFLLLMFLLFQSLFTWAAPLMDLIDGLVGFLGQWASEEISNTIVRSLFVDGILAGVGSVVVFVPQIALTFLFIGFLEMTGYLARGGFLIDRLMRAVGLEGRAFVPLISSFACAIPGILATRTLSNPRQRLLTILIAPLMTCSARLPVYTLIIAAFVPASAKILGLPAQGMTLFALFLLGIVAGMLVSLVLSKTIFAKSASHFILELPPYRLPGWKNIYYYVSFRVLAFLKTAGSIIFVLSLILWALAYFPHSENIAKKYELERQILLSTQMPDDDLEIRLTEIGNKESGEFLRQSYMGRLGKFLEPAFAPLGFDWRMSIGVLASFAAREVFVSTMGIVFNLGEVDESSTGLIELLHEAKGENGLPLYTLGTALALLVFFALASQCISTLATIRRETNSWRWPAFVFVYMSVLAYLGALLVSQGFRLWA